MSTGELAGLFFSESSSVSVQLNSHFSAKIWPFRDRSICDKAPIHTPWHMMRDHQPEPQRFGRQLWSTLNMAFLHVIFRLFRYIYIYIWYSETPKSSTLGDWGPLPRAARSASWHHLRLHGWALVARNWAENWAEQIGKHVIFEDQISRFRFGTVIIQPHRILCHD